MRKNHRLLGKTRKTKILFKSSKAASLFFKISFNFSIKEENRNINVAEQTNIPQFSKLDNIGTPLRLFESFFVDVLVDMIVGYTKLDGHRDKAETSL